MAASGDGLYGRSWITNPVLQDLSVFAIRGRAWAYHRWITAATMACLRNVGATSVDQGGLGIMARKTIAIDPGSTQSAYVIWDGIKIIEKEIIRNQALLFLLIKMSKNKSLWDTPLVIEQIKSYGMAVGATVFDTVFWSGRFYQVWKSDRHLMPRLEVKKHICHNGLAKDSNITQALIDRFAYGVRNKGKGVKKDPGFFYGFSKDIWQAFALAVTWFDQYGKVV